LTTAPPSVAGSTGARSGRGCSPRTDRSCGVPVEELTQGSADNGWRSLDNTGHRHRGAPLRLPPRSLSQGGVGERGLGPAPQRFELAQALVAGVGAAKVIGRVPVAA